MKLVIEGQKATLYKGDKAILVISTKNDVLTAEVLDIDSIQHVGLSQLASVVECEDIGPVMEGFEPAPGIIVQREIETPCLGDVVNELCRKARLKGK